MSPISALRAARPEAPLHRGTDARAEADLRAILGPEALPTRRRPQRHRGVLVLNAAIAVLIVAVAAASLIAFGRVRHDPASTPTATASASAAARLFVKPADYFLKEDVPRLSGQRFALGTAPNGCVTVNGLYLIAPKGSSLQGRTLDLSGVGQVPLGGALQSGWGLRVDWTGKPTATLHGTFACGAGAYLDLQSAHVPTATSGPTATITRTTTYSANGKDLPACRFSDLVTWASQSTGGEGGYFYQGFSVQNTGSTCSLSTTPLTVAGGGQTAALIPESSQVVLPAGTSMRILLGQRDGCEARETSRGPVPLSFALDGQSRPLHVTFPLAPAAECGTASLQTTGLETISAATEPDYDGALRQVAVTGLADSSYTGGALDYTVTLTNHSTTTFDPAKTPFVQVAMSTKRVLVQTGSFGAAAPIPPGGSERFGVHSDAPADAGELLFFLADGPSTSTDG